MLLLVSIYLGAAGLGLTLSTTNHGKQDLPISCYSNSFLDACISEATDGGEEIAHINNDNSLVAAGCSPSFVAQINQYNSPPDIGCLKAEYGTMNVLNGTAMACCIVRQMLNAYLHFHHTGVCYLELKKL